VTGATILRRLREQDGQGLDRRFDLAHSALQSRQGSHHADALAALGLLRALGQESRDRAGLLRRQRERRQRTGHARGHGELSRETNERRERLVGLARAQQAASDQPVPHVGAARGGRDGVEPYGLEAPVVVGGRSCHEERRL
jgi:hypothetical protein